MSNTVQITDEEFNILDCCLQYGNLSGARYIFMGLEEGLNEQDPRENLDGRKRWFSEIPQNIRYIGKNMDMTGGYYVDHSMKAGWVRWKKDREDCSLAEYTLTHKRVQVLMAHARMMVVLEEGMEVLQDNTFKQKVLDYYRYRLYAPNSNNHMLDLYGMPRQGSRMFGHPRLMGRKQQLTPERHAILESVYDQFPMITTICYAGIEAGEFRAQTFFESIGFQFDDPLDTSVVHPQYKNDVNPATKPKKFKIGCRLRNSDGHQQLVVLTPFFMLGGGNCTYADIDVITTWVKHYDLESLKSTAPVR